MGELYDILKASGLRGGAGGGGGSGFTPTQEQLDAMNSGIDSEKVAQIETNKNNISSNTAEISGQQNATTDTVAGRGYAIINGQRLYMGAAPMPERVGDIWLDGTTARASEYLLTDTPLCGIDTYKDTLNLATGQITRTIKKLTIDGTERIEQSTNPNYYNINFSQQQLGRINFICTHFKAANYSGNISQGEMRFADDTRITVNYDAGSGGVSNFISWLQQQYANGTPVTIWYVLAEPQTEQITVPSGLSGTVEGYLIQDGTPTSSAPIYPTANQVLVWG